MQTMGRSDYWQSPYDSPPAKSKKQDNNLAALIVGIVFFAFGAYGLNAGLANMYDGYVDSTGTIVSVNRYMSCSRRSHSSSRRCSELGTPTIEYTADGQKVTAKSDLSSSSYDDSDVGKQVKVKYDPSDPSEVVVASDADLASPIMAIFVFGFMGIGALIMVISLKDLLKKAVSLAISR